MQRLMNMRADLRLPSGHRLRRSRSRDRPNGGGDEQLALAVVAQYSILPRLCIELRWMRRWAISQREIAVETAHPRL